MNVRLCFIIICTLCCSTSFAADSAPTLVVASSGSHLWVAVPTDSGCRIVHHALEMDGPFVREVATLPTLPIALAAHENQLAIIMPPTGIPLMSPVYSLTTNRNPATGSFYYQPYGRLDVLPSIESAAKITSAVLEMNAVLALIPGEKQELIRAGSMSWSNVPLPQSANSLSTLAPWSGLGGSTEWAILCVEGDDLVTWTPATDSVGGWSQARWPAAGIGFQMVICGSNRPAILSREATGTFVIVYPTSSGLRTLGSISVPTQPWSIVGLGNTFQIVSTDKEGAVRLTSIDSISGLASADEVLSAQPTTTGDWIHLPFIGALTIGMLLAGFIVRPPLEPPHQMSGGWIALPMFRRIAALAIDLIPGAIFALWITGARVEELMSMPSWTPDLALAAPASIMLGFTGIWCGIFEVVLRATPGKFIFGGRIVRAPDGGTDMRAGVGRSLLRALLKTVVLFAPALGFLAFVHPLQQGLPETLSKTVVARRH